MTAHIFLAKQSDDLVSHCRCAKALITYPPQQDCPWCGCGWLFTCQTCRKAFTFAVGIETEEPWEVLARRDLQGQGLKEPSERQIEAWVKVMRSMLSAVRPGTTYVIFDGCLLPADATGLQLTGWYARHALNVVPQTAALRDPSLVGSVLTNRDYWTSRKTG
jgi:hypothetical protein